MSLANVFLWFPISFVPSKIYLPNEKATKACCTFGSCSDNFNFYVYGTLVWSTVQKKIIQKL